MLSYQREISQTKNPSNKALNYSSKAAQNQSSGLLLLNRLVSSLQRSASQSSETSSEHEDGPKEHQNTPEEQYSLDLRAVEEELTLWERGGTLSEEELQDFDLVFHWDVCIFTLNIPKISRI